MEPMEYSSPEPVPGFNALDYPLLGAFWARQSTLLKKINTSIRIIEELKNGYELHADDFVALNLSDCFNLPDLEGYHKAMIAMKKQLDQCQSQLDRLFVYAPTVSPGTYERRQEEQQRKRQRDFLPDEQPQQQPPVKRGLFFDGSESSNSIQEPQGSSNSLNFTF